jgi:predicted branched-subunit amino acid permease
MAQAPDPQAKQTRIASIVIIVAFTSWMGMSWIGGRIGLPTRFAFLIDFAALAALFWAMVVLFWVWRKRQQNGPGNEGQ